MTDWGMRIISNKSAHYGAGGYHYGSVWPLFTGWAAVGEYRYHREKPAYGNLRANALLARDGSPGHVTEVLSGDYYQPLSTASPHQIWSGAMVISPVLRGMLGLETDATHHTIVFSPHAPADWTRVAVSNIRMGESVFDLKYGKTEKSFQLEVARTAGKEDCTFEFRPAVSLRSTVSKAELNGRAIQFKVEPSENDQHVVVRIPVGAEKESLRIYLERDFSVSSQSVLPSLGSASEGLRIVSEAWSPSKDQLDLEVSGAAGHEYELEVWNAGQIERVVGASLSSTKSSGRAFLSVQIPKATSEPFPHSHIVIHFGTKPVKR